MTKFHNCKVVGDGISHDVYAKQPDGVKRGDVVFVMSRGELMTFAECPAKWIAGVENKDTKATDWGDLVDSMLLSPAKFEARFVVSPKTYGDGKEWTYKADYCKKWREEKEVDGFTVTSDADMKKATTALDALKKNKDIMELVECSKTQVMATGEYRDGATGLAIALKVLLDLVPDKGHARFGKTLADFKTARNAAMFSFGRQINESHYDAQCWLYRSIYATATGEDRVDWELATQENTEPFHSELYILSDYFVSNGQVKILKALQLYCWCLTRNVWPGFGAMARTKYQGTAIIAPEDWMISRLADFCPIPDLPEAKEQSEDIPH